MPVLGCEVTNIYPILNFVAYLMCSPQRLFFVLFLSPFCFTTAQDSLDLYAQPKPISSDRVGFGVRTEILPKRTFQFETGLSLHPQTFTLAGTIVGVNTIAQTNLFRWGISKKTELRFEANFFKQTQYAALPEYQQKMTSLLPRIGFKTKILENRGWLPAITLSSMSNLGAFYTLLRSRHLIVSSFVPIPTFDIQLSFHNKIGNRAHLRYNIGTFWRGMGAGISHYGALSFEYDLSPKFRFYTQAKQFVSNFEGKYRPSTSLEAGINYSPLPNLQLDFSGGIPLIGGIGTNRGFAKAGLTWRFGK
jgi:hypothetical protein